jgi:hypothetical protein
MVRKKKEGRPNSSVCTKQCFFFTGVDDVCQELHRTLLVKHLQEMGMDWIELAQDRDGWRAPVNVLMNLRIPKNTRIFLTS